MEPAVVGMIGFAVLVLLIFLRLSIGIAMLLVGVIGTGYLTTMNAGISILGISPYFTAANYTFTVVPLFILMGSIGSETGLVRDAYSFFYKWCGHLPGGLAITTTGACAVFAALTGSSVASAATMSKVALPEMVKVGYDRKLATGTVAAGGTLGILIPPSIPFVIYGIITETSIGKLLIAGIIPGILLTFLFIVVILIWAKLNPSIAPPGTKAGWYERFSAIKSVWGALTLIVVVIGGIYTGIFTATEAAAVGAFMVFLVSFMKKQFTWQILKTSVKETIETSGMIFIILMGAMVFNYFMAVSKLPIALADFVSLLSLPSYFVYALIIIILLVLGCIMDALGMVLLTMPIFFPIITKLGFDPIWFGVIVVITMEAGLISPPVGLNAFIVAGMAKVPLYDVFRGIVPFFVAMLVCIVILTIWPQIALILPTLME